LDPLLVQDIIQEIREFDAFDAANDPHGEHDFAQMVIQSEIVIWKIDYYDLAEEMHSLDASDPAVTRRVMTIMLASEY
jgi:hypothetical protein